MESSTWSVRGQEDCILDRCENVTFASIGGLEQRGSLLNAPNYIPVEHIHSYTDGYVAQARDMYGDDWQTCKFGWAQVLKIEGTA